MKNRFEVLFLESAAIFLESIPYKDREKILYNIKKAQQITDKELFSKLQNDIWEFRTLFNKTHYRLFAFWDKKATNSIIVIATHGIIKKNERLPSKELKIAENIMNEYYQSR
jgi:phage-related protein